MRPHAFTHVTSRIIFLSCELRARMTRTLGKWLTRHILKRGHVLAKTMHLITGARAFLGIRHIRPCAFSIVPGTWFPRLCLSDRTGEPLNREVSSVFTLRREYVNPAGSWLDTRVNFQRKGYALNEFANVSAKRVYLSKDGWKRKRKIWNSSGRFTRDLVLQM